MAEPFRMGVNEVGLSPEADKIGTTDTHTPLFPRKM
jgi:hypothetical protein